MSPSSACLRSWPMQLVLPDPPINHPSHPSANQPRCHMLVFNYVCIQTTPGSIYAGEKKITGNPEDGQSIVCMANLLLNIRSTNNSPNCAEAFRRTIFMHEVFGSQCAWEVRINSTTVQGVMNDGAKLWQFRTDATSKDWPSDLCVIWCQSTDPFWKCVKFHSHYFPKCWCAIDTTLKDSHCNRGVAHTALDNYTSISLRQLALLDYFSMFPIWMYS